jgi:hypothetical protein
LLTSSLPALAQAPQDPVPGGWDLVVTLEPYSGYFPEGVVLDVRFENLGNDPAPMLLLDFTLAVGGQVFGPEDIDGFARLSEGDWVEFSGLPELGPLAPGEVRFLELGLNLPDEAMALLQDPETRPITVRLDATQRADPRPSVVPPPSDVDLSNNTVFANLGPVPTANGHVDRPEPVLMPPDNGDDDLPDLLPWPPPEASARLVLDPARLRAELDRGPEGRTLGHLGDLIEAALIEDGHRDIGYLGVPGDGFALLTGLEQVDEDAAPLTTGRFSDIIMVDPSAAESPGAWLQEFIAALLFAPEGHFRVLAFIVTDVPVSEDPNLQIDPDILGDWEARSVSSLPPSLRDIPYGSAHDVTVLVYEFVKETDDGPATLATQHSVQTHLRSSRLNRFLPGQ